MILKTIRFHVLDLLAGGGRFLSTRAAPLPAHALLSLPCRWTVVLLTVLDVLAEGGCVGGSCVTHVRLRGALACRRAALQPHLLGKKMESEIDKSVSTHISPLMIGH